MSSGHRHVWLSSIRYVTFRGVRIDLLAEAISPKVRRSLEGLPAAPAVLGTDESDDNRFGIVFGLARVELSGEYSINDLAHLGVKSSCDIG